MCLNEHCKFIGKLEGVHFQWSGSTDLEKNLFEDVAGATKAIYDEQVAEWREHCQHNGHVLTEDYMYYRCFQSSGGVLS